MDKQWQYHGPEHGENPQRDPTDGNKLYDTGPARPFTPEQEERIREIVFAMTHLALEDYYVRQGKPAISSLADDFWREPDGSIPPKPLSEEPLPQVLTQGIPAG